MGANQGGSGGPDPPWADVLIFSGRLEEGSGPTGPVFTVSVILNVKYHIERFRIVGLFKTVFTNGAVGKIWAAGIRTPPDFTSDLRPCYRRINKNIIDIVGSLENNWWRFLSNKTTLFQGLRFMKHQGKCHVDAYINACHQICFLFSISALLSILHFCFAFSACQFDLLCFLLLPTAIFPAYSSSAWDRHSHRLKNTVKF